MNVEFFECPLRAATEEAPPRHSTLAISLRSLPVAAQFFVHSRMLSIFMSCTCALSGTCAATVDLRGARWSQGTSADQRRAWRRIVPSRRVIKSRRRTAV
jgi:hypothetical protein